MNRTVFINNFECATAYGPASKDFHDGIFANITAFRETPMIHPVLKTRICGAWAGWIKDDSIPRVFSLIRAVAKNMPPLPEKTQIFIATTVGAIELLEKDAEAGIRSSEPHTQALFRFIEDLFRTKKITMLSGACAASTEALAHASMLISQGKIDNALVIAADSMSDFVCSGFASLNVISPTECRPFDKARDGLFLGEAAAAVLLTSEKNPGKSIGRICGWASNADAFHATAPCPGGEPLAEAIASAINKAGLSHDDISFIAAHGTGTSYNDSMEAEAFVKAFGGRIPPAFSIKGGCGHTLAAGGLLQLETALESFRRGIIPANVNMLEPMDEMKDVVNTECRRIESKKPMSALSVSSGFTGINSAIVIEPLP